MADLKKIKCICACRVSSKEQEESGYSLDSQEKLLTDYAELKKFETSRVFKVTESASGKQIRKSFNEMIAYCDKNKVDVILCEKIDRLTRNLKDAVIIDDWIRAKIGREVHFVKEGFILNRNTKAHESLVWDMKVAIARFYTNNLSEEVRKGQKEKLAQGWLPTKPNIGYITTGDKGHKIHVMDQFAAPIITELFEQYASGQHSLKSITKLAAERRLRSKKGKIIGKSAIYNILKSPYYISKITWLGQTYQGKHEPLTTKEVWERVQTNLGRQLKNPQFRKHLPVFKANIVCEECAGTITWEIQKGLWYGHCNHYKQCSQKKYVRQERVEEQLFPLFDAVAPKNDRVLDWLNRALKADHATESEQFMIKRQNFTAELNRVQQRLDGIYEDKLDGLISRESYLEKLDQYKEQKDDILNSLNGMEDDNDAYYRAGYAIHELAFNAKKIYESEKTTVEDKRLMLSYIFSNLSLESDRIKPNFTLAFDFLLNNIPLLNSTFEPIKSEFNIIKTGVLTPALKQTSSRLSGLDSNQ